MRRFGDKGCKVLDTFNCEALRITGTGWPGPDFDSVDLCTKPFTGQHIASAKQMEEFDYPTAEKDTENLCCDKPSNLEEEKLRKIKMLVFLLYMTHR